MWTFFFQVQSEMLKRLLNAKEASEYLSLHLKTVYDLVSRNEIPSGKVGGSIRIDRLILDEILSQQSSQSRDWEI